MMALGQLDAIERLGQRADLIDFDQDAVRGPLGDAFLEPLDVGREQVIADELDFVAEFLGELLPAGPVVLGQAVLDGTDRPLGAEHFPQVDHFVGTGHAILLALEEAVAVLLQLFRFVEEFGAGRVEGVDHVLAGL